MDMGERVSRENEKKSHSFCCGIFTVDLPVFAHGIHYDLRGIITKI